MDYITVETVDGVKISARVFLPREDCKNSLVVVLVHPYSLLGGSQGLLRGIAGGLSQNGYSSITFDMRGAGRSTGSSSLTGFAEVNDVIAVCNWAREFLSTNKILLVGSSAGAAIAGSAVDKMAEIIGYVSIGYPFGLLASTLFGRHHSSLLHSPKPKLFVMGTRDGFTSVKQLQSKLKTAAGRADIHLLEGAGHFQMEGPEFDTNMVHLILSFINTLL